MDEVARYLSTIPESRLVKVRHFMEVISTAEPALALKYWDYAGGLVGYGHYHYRYASGRTGEYFMVGIGSRQKYIAIYANAADGHQYLVETFRDRLPGCKIGKSCIEVPDRASISDEVLAELTRQTASFFRAEMSKPKAPGTMHIWE